MSGYLADRGTRVVLITGAVPGDPAGATARNAATQFAECLRDRCGVAGEQIAEATIRGGHDREDVLQALDRHASQAFGPMVVWYAGPTSRDAAGQLCLGPDGAVAFAEVNSVLTARRHDWPTLLILDCPLPSEDLRTNPEWGVLGSASPGTDPVLTSRLAGLLRTGLPGGQPEISLQEACRHLAQAASGDQDIPILRYGARIGSLVLAPNPAGASAAEPDPASAARGAPVQSASPASAVRRPRTGRTVGIVAVVAVAVIATGTAVGLMRRTGGDSTAKATVSPAAPTDSPAASAGAASAGTAPTARSRLGLRLAKTIAAPEPIGQVLFSPDGKTLAIAYEGMDNTPAAIQLWDVASGTKRVSITAMQSTIMAWSPDSQTIATGGTTIQLWNATTGKMTRQFKDQATDAYGSVAISPDGKTLAAADSNGVQLWNLPTGVMAKEIHVPFSNIGPIAFSHDGTMLAVGGQNYYSDKTYAGAPVFLWNVSSGRLIGTSHGLVHPPSGLTESNATASSLSFSPDDRTLAVATEVEMTSAIYSGIRLWTLASGKETLLTAGGGGWVTYNPDGTVLAAENADGANVRLWDTRTRHPITTINFPSTPTGAVPLSAMSTLAFSPDGRKLAVPDGNSTQIWNLGAG